MKKFFCVTLLFFSGIASAWEPEKVIEIDDRLSKEEYLSLARENPPKLPTKTGSSVIHFIKEGADHRVPLASYSLYKRGKRVWDSVTMKLLSREEYQRMLEPVPDKENKGYFWQWMDPDRVPGNLFSPEVGDGGRKYAFYEHNGDIYVDAFYGFNDYPNPNNGKSSDQLDMPLKLQVSRNYLEDGSQGSMVLFNSPMLMTNVDISYALVDGRVFKVSVSHIPFQKDDEGNQVYKVDDILYELPIIYD